MVTVRLEPDRIRVNEETLATAESGRPFDESEYTADRCGSFWSSLREKLSDDTWRRAAALAGRMACAVVPCDVCGRTARMLTTEGAVLTYDGPFSAPARVEIGAETREALRAALAAHDMPAVRGLNPAWAEGHCAACDASYCKNHLDRGQGEGAGHLMRSYARCPHGHRWDV